MICNKNNRSPDVGTPVMVYVSKGFLECVWI